MNIFNTLKTDDEYFTRYEAWADVAPYLPKNMVVWEVFYSPHSRSPTYLRELGSRSVVGRHAQICASELRVKS